MMKLRPLLTAVGFVLVLTACAQSIDKGQLRVCRMLLPVLNPAGTTFEILGVEALPRDGGVRVAYSAEAPGELIRRRFVHCGFAAPDAQQFASTELVSIVTDSGSIGDLRVWLIKRRWIDSAEAVAADPAPVAEAARAPEVPMIIAIGLQQVMSAAPLVSIYGLLAAAYSLVYGLVGRINLAFGEIATIGSYAALLGFAAMATGSVLMAPLAAALVLACLIGGAYGTVAGRLVLMPLLRAGGQQALIGTLAVAIILQEYMRLIQGAKTLWLQPVLNEPTALARSGHFIVTLTPIALLVCGLALAASLALLGMLRWSRFGRCWRASADDPKAAALFGVDPERTLLITLMLASALAGLAGYVMTLYYGSVGHTGGIVIGLKALLAAIAGGIGSVPGAFFGGLLLGLAEASWSALLPLEYRDPAILGLFVMLLVLRPGGLLGFGDLLPRRV